MEEVVLNTGDTAWMLISTGLVVLMIPGLALFYGGMVRVKSVLNMMMMFLCSEHIGHGLNITVCKSLRLSKF